MVLFLELIELVEFAHLIQTDTQSGTLKTRAVELVELLYLAHLTKPDTPCATSGA